MVTLQKRAGNEYLLIKKFVFCKLVVTKVKDYILQPAAFSMKKMKKNVWNDMQGASIQSAGEGTISCCRFS